MDPLLDFAPQMLIDGMFVRPWKVCENIDPALGEPFMLTPIASSDQIEMAINCAVMNSSWWGRSDISARLQLLEELSGCLRRHVETLAYCITREQGKTIAAAREEVLAAASQLQKIARSWTDEIFDDNAGGSKVRHPLGVIAIVGHPNLPLASLIWQMGRAIVAGNTVVAAPPPTAPLTCLIFAKLICDFVPPGIINIVTSNFGLGRFFASHPAIAMVVFAGSKAAGRKMAAVAARTGKRAQLHIRGGSIAVLLPSVDIWAASNALFQSATENAGQSFVAAKICFVAQPIFEEFCQAIAHHAEEAIVDSGLVANCNLGPLHDGARYQVAKDLLEHSHSVGRVIAGGALDARPGYFVRPTVVTNVEGDSPLKRSAHGCPIVYIEPFETERSVSLLINDHPSCSAASVWANDTARAREWVGRLTCREIWLNAHPNELAVTADPPRTQLEFCQTTIVHDTPAHKHSVH